MVVQNVPQIAPFIRTNRTETPNFFAGNQMMKQDSPVARVINPLMLILPYLSLNKPTSGRPNAIPRLRRAPRTLPWTFENPLDVAKSRFMY
jgi:hypothetical protein